MSHDDFRGPRVTLRAPTLDDAEPLFEIASDPEVSRHMSWRPHRNMEETRRVITEVLNVGGETTRLITLTEDETVIGAIGRRPQPHIVDFGYYLGRQWWGRGLMSEAVRYTALPNISEEPQDCLLFAKAVK